MDSSSKSGGDALKVTITGDLGSGKSIAAKAIAKHFGIDRHSSGDFQRRAAEERGVSTSELNSNELATQWLDKAIDGQLEALGGSKQSVIVDARLGWHFIPDSFKIKILTKPSIAAQRIFADTSRSTEKYSNVAEAEGAIIERQAEEWRRFKEKYGADFSNDNNFDLIIDTSFATPDAMLEIVMDALDKHKNGMPYNKYWVSPLQLIPTESVREIGEDLCSTWASEMRANGYGDNDPIVACKVNRNLLIASGHALAFGAASTDVELVPLAVMPKGADLVWKGLNAQESLTQSATPRNVYDWQEALCCCRERMGFDDNIEFTQYYPQPTSDPRGYGAPSPLDA